ncbi:MAG TPA: 50S ribosomal protein L3 [Patescibacteria group bacterium]|nr:50S ribosomal protein L3 [Patescibacteria group bacterium]
MKFILGKKLEMTQIFENDKRVPVTKIKAGPCLVSQVKTKEGTDGYNAVQIGFEKRTKNIKNYNKKKPFKHLTEFRFENTPKLKNGEKLTVDQFEKGDHLKITGVSKGKGFQGVMKRHGFSGFPRSHGHNKGHTRFPGSIGATDPERVFPNKKMAGRTGGDTITTSNLELLKVDSDKNILFIKGSVPGSRGTFLKIKA